MKEVRVLLVEDHLVVRAGLRAVIDAAPDISVIAEAGTGIEALRYAAELAPDVVVMDISMPEMDGAVAMERLHRTQPDLPVLILTAHEDRGHVTRLLQAGAAGYLLKRAAADDLIRAIRIIADGGNYVDPRLGGRLLAGRDRARPGPAPGLEDPLSTREEDVLRRIAWGESNKTIAAELGVSTKTVETYKARLATKLQLNSRAEMVRYAVQRGWLSDI